jgi:hypothetical protein
MNASNLTRAQLLKALDKAHRAHFVVVDEMIDAGRGRETSLDIVKKSDALSQRWNKSMETWRGLDAERQRRIETHGTEQRIRRVECSLARGCTY